MVGSAGRLEHVELDSAAGAGEERNRVSAVVLKWTAALPRVPPYFIIAS